MATTVQSANISMYTTEDVSSVEIWKDGILQEIAYGEGYTIVRNLVDANYIYVVQSKNRQWYTDAIFTVSGGIITSFVNYVHGGTTVDNYIEKKGTQDMEAGPFRDLSGNVKALGAVGNGIINDQPIIQGVIDSMGNGGTIYFPPGTYRLNSPLTITGRHNMTLAGAGWSLTRFDIYGTNFLNVDSSDALVLRDFNVENWTAGNTNTCINVTNYPRRHYYNRLQISNFGGIGISMEGGSQTIIEHVYLQQPSTYTAGIKVVKHPTIGNATSLLTRLNTISGPLATGTGIDVKDAVDTISELDIVENASTGARYDNVNSMTIIGFFTDGVPDSNKVLELHDCLGVVIGGRRTPTVTWTNVPTTARYLLELSANLGGELRGVRGISGYGNVGVNNFCGTVTISNTATSGTVNFGGGSGSAGNETNTNYRLSVTPVSQSGNPRSGSNRVTSVTKSLTGFTVYVEAYPGNGNSVTFDWHLVR